MLIISTYHLNAIGYIGVHSAQVLNPNLNSATLRHVRQAQFFCVIFSIILYFVGVAVTVFHEHMENILTVPYCTGHGVHTIATTVREARLKRFFERWPTLMYKT